MAVPAAIFINWDEAATRRFLDDPHGGLGRTVMDALGQIVEDGARGRALRRTGRMAAEITHSVGVDERGLYAQVSSPVRDPRTGFPYATVHEGRRVRDRRAHRSLRPALRDIRKIETRR